MAKVDELTVEILGDIRGLTKALKDSVKATEETTEKMQSSFEKVTGAITGVQAGFAKFGLAVQGVQAAFGPFVSAMEKVNSVAGLKKTANLVGVNVERFQELSFAARSVGVDSETFGDALKDLNVKITDAANGAESYEEVLNLVGLKSKELVNLPVDKQFERFAEAMGKASDETRRFVADEINDSMFQLNTLLAEGSKGLENYTKKARDLGVVMSSSEMDEVQELNKSFNELKSSADALAGKLISKLSPALQAIVDVATEATKAVGGLAGDEAQKDADTMADKIEKQKEKIRLLNVELVKAEAAAIDFEDSIFRAFQPEKAEILKIEVNEVKEKIRLAKEEMEGLRQAQQGLGGMMTGEGTFGGTGATAQGSVVGAPVESPAAAAAGEDVGPAEKKKNLDMGYGVYGPDDFDDLMSRNFEQFAMLEEQRKMFLDRELNQYENQIKQTQWLWESGAQGKLKVTKGFFNNLLTITQGKSRKMFEFNKALGIADATVSTFKGAAKALELPFPANIAAASSVIATGMAQVAKIQSVEFGGGGAGGGGGGASAPAAANTEALQQAEATQTTNFDVTLQGDSFSGEQIRGLIGQINEATDDGVKLNAVMVS